MERGRRKPPGTWREKNPSSPRRVRVVPRRKTPQVERREACVPYTRHAGAFVEVPLLLQRLSALLPHACEGKKRRRRPGAEPFRGPMNHVCGAV